VSLLGAGGALGESGWVCAMVGGVSGYEGISVSESDMMTEPSAGQDFKDTATGL
jgi:hypothetical protein